jgi:hypothetical protein
MTDDLGGKAMPMVGKDGNVHQRIMPVEQL